MKIGPLRAKLAKLKFYIRKGLKEGINHNCFWMLDTLSPKCNKNCMFFLKLYHFLSPFEKSKPKIFQKMEKELRGYELCSLDNPCYALNSRRLFCLVFMVAAHWAFYSTLPPGIGLNKLRLKCYQCWQKGSDLLWDIQSISFHWILYNYFLFFCTFFVK